MIATLVTVAELFCRILQRDDREQELSVHLASGSRAVPAVRLPVPPFTITRTWSTVAVEVMAILLVLCLLAMSVGVTLTAHAEDDASLAGVVGVIVADAVPLVGITDGPSPRNTPAAQNGNGMRECGARRRRAWSPSAPDHHDEHA